MAPDTAAHLHRENVQSASLIWPDSEPTTAARLASVHDRIAEALPAGGFLRCNVCHRREDALDVAANLRHGWPKCCDLTMTWWTPRQIAAGEAPV